MGPLSQRDLEAAAIELGLSRSFLYKLLARYKRRPQTSSFLFAKRGRPEDSRSLDQEREQLVQTAIQEFYLRRERPRMGDLIKEIRRLCNQQNVNAPNYRTTGPSVSVFGLWTRRWLRNGGKALKSLTQSINRSGSRH